MNKLELGIG